jgi:hypothetical protein
VTAWPSCGEGTGAFLGQSRQAGAGLRRDVDEDERARRDAANRARARRRAAGRLRRFGAHNLLGNLSTLTYRCIACDEVPCSCGRKANPEREQVVRHWQALRKAMYDRRGPAPYFAVIEEGSRSGRRHLHVATRAHWSQEDLEEIWRWGFVMPGRHEDPEAMSWSEARAAAGYCSTYAGKALDAGYGRQSYFVAQGFQPQPVQGWVESEADALGWLCERLGGFDTLSRSDEWGEDYVGPPALSVRLG